MIKSYFCCKALPFQQRLKILISMEKNQLKKLRLSNYFKVVIFIFYLNCTIICFSQKQLLKGNWNILQIKYNFQNNNYDTLVQKANIILYRFRKLSKSKIYAPTYISIIVNDTLKCNSTQLAIIEIDSLNRSIIKLQKIDHLGYLPNSTPPYKCIPNFFLGSLIIMKIEKQILLKSLKDEKLIYLLNPQ